MNYSSTYRKYLRWISWLGGYRQKKHPQAQHVTLREVNPDFDVADRNAARYGDQYRGAGVAVGLLGISIVFVALAPVGLSIHSGRVLVGMGALKIALMLWILWLVFQFGQRSKLSQLWIETRCKAEELRYSKLKRLKNDLARSSIKSEDQTQMLHDELSSILSGNNDDGQIRYNQSKGEMYEAIERFGERLSWWGFALALVCAIMLLLSEVHLVGHMPWLIFGTAALPALVGGIHGINGFLKIGALAEEHLVMAKLLKGFSIELEHTPISDADSVLAIAERTYGQLVSRDVLWGESTQKSAKIKPA